MPKVTTVGHVLVPVANQDAAIAFYTGKLGCLLTADAPFGDGDRWVEVTPSGGGAAIALTPPRGEFQPGRVTGLSLTSADPRGDHAELAGQGVDVDPELWGGAGGVPLGFFFRDQDANQLMIVEG